MPSDSTGQFHVDNMGEESVGGSAVVLDTRLYYVSTGVSDQMKIVSCNIRDLQAGNLNSVKSNDNWARFNLSEKISDPNGARLHTEFRPAAVLLDRTLYIFWVDTTQSGQVYMVSMDQTGTLSVNTYRVYAKEQPLVASSDLSANVAPDGTSIILNWFDPSNVHLRTLVLEPSAIDNGTAEWKGRSPQADVDPVRLGLAPVTSTYSRISTVWFTQGGNTIYMLASFYSSDVHRVYFLLYPIKRNGEPVAVAERRRRAVTIGDLAVRRGFTMSLEPGGRIHGLYCKEVPEGSAVRTQIFYRVFATDQDFEAKSGTFQWGPEAMLNESSDESFKAPVIAFVAGDASPTSISQRPAEVRELESRRSRQYSFALYAAEGETDNKAYNIQCQVAFYGTSFLVSNFNTIEPKPEYARRQLVSLLMDSFPFPNENLGVVAVVPPSRRIIEYTYGASSTTQLSVMASVETLVGIKVKESFTFGPIGEATEAQLRAGVTGTLASRSTTAQADGYSVFTTPIPKPGSPTQLKIEEHGQYYGTTPLTLVEDIALFQLPDRAITNGRTGPSYIAIRPSRASASRVSGQYPAFCYTPGNIRSYEEATIDATMRGLYEGLTDKQREALKNTGYSTGYIQDVIVPKAQTILGRKFLQFTMGGSGSSSTQLMAIDEIMGTFGFKIDGSFYTGGSVKAGAEALGLGGMLSVLAGFEFSVSTISGVGNISTWGISFINNAPSAVAGALAYTVRMYLCKPDNLWARELEFFAHENVNRHSIDFDNSIPSKIMFVVSDIEATATPTR